MGAISALGRRRRKKSGGTKRKAGRAVAIGKAVYRGRKKSTAKKSTARRGRITAGVFGAGRKKATTKKRTGGVMRGLVSFAKRKGKAVARRRKPSRRRVNTITNGRGGVLRRAVRSGVKRATSRVRRGVKRGVGAVKRVHKASSRIRRGVRRLGRGVLSRRRNRR